MMLINMLFHAREYNFQDLSLIFLANQNVIQSRRTKRFTVIILKDLV
jgi:hypothetical protein